MTRFLILAALIGLLCSALVGCGSRSTGTVVKPKITAKAVDGASILAQLKNPPTITPVVQKQDAGTTPYITYNTWVVNSGGDVIGEFDSTHIPTGQEIVDRYEDLFNSEDQFSQPAGAVTFGLISDYNVGAVAGFEF